MASLTGKTPAETYKDLLQVSNLNQGVDDTVRVVEDGEGTESALRLSTNEVKIKPLSDGYTFEVVDTNDAVIFSINTSTKEVTAGTGVSFIGDGSQLSGIGGIGGYSNAGNTNLVADNDTDGNGDVAISIGTSELIRLKNNGNGDGGSWTIASLDESKLATLTGDEVAYVNIDGVASTQDANGVHPIALTDKFVITGGVMLNGNGDYYKIPYSSAMAIGGNNFTICAVVKTSTYGSTIFPRIFDNHDGSTGIFVFVSNLGKLRIKFNSISATTFDTVIADDKIHYVRVEVDRGNGVIKAYIDNRLEPTTIDISSDTSDVTSTKDWHIGWNGADSTSYFNGSFVRVKVFNYLPSDDETGMLYNNGLGGELPYEHKGASFEDNAVDGGMEGTLTDSWSSLNTMSAETSIVHNGSQSAKIVMDSVNAIIYGNSGVNSWANYEVGKKVRVKAWVYIASGWSSGDVALSDTNSNSTYEVIKQWEQGVSATDTWVELESIVTVQSQTDRPRVRAQGTVSSGDVIYVDDIEYHSEGEVLELKGDKAGSNGWLDSSGNNLHAISSGNPIAINKVRDYGEMATDSYTMVNSIKEDNILTKLIISNTSASNATNLLVQMGTVTIVSGETVNAGQTKVFVLNRYITDTDLSFSIDSAVDKLKIKVISEEL